MNEARSARIVQKLHPAFNDDIGDLVTRRPLPGPQLPHLDPFLFLNHHGPQVYPPGNQGLPFGPHPHRGFATVTFILAGELRHEDSAGHGETLGAGGAQWMSAGRGLVHSEISPAAFREKGGPLEILQLWINLPARLKMGEPAYADFAKSDIPVLNLDEGKAKVKLLAGDWEGGGPRGPLVPPFPLLLAEIELSPGAALRFPAAPEDSILFYVISGSATVNGVPAPEYHAVEFGGGGGPIAVVSARGARILYGTGRAHGEPIFSYGPFVMNSEAEIHQAIRDYQAGKFK